MRSNPSFVRTVLALVVLPFSVAVLGTQATRAVGSVIPRPSERLAPARRAFPRSANANLSQRCTALTLRTGQCRNWRMKGHTYCRSHLGLEQGQPSPFQPRDVVMTGSMMTTQ